MMRSLAQTNAHICPAVGHERSCFGLFLPGAILIRSESGQLVLLSQQALAQTQQGPARVSAPLPRPAAPQVCVGCVR